MEPLSDDLKELIALLRKHRAEFLVVGAHALAFWAEMRQTMDLDLWIRQSRENVHRVRLALDEFGFKIGDEGETEFMRRDQMLVLGRVPNQVDILAFLHGCDFESAWPRRVAGTLDGEDVDFLSLEDYVATKRTVARPKDLADLVMIKRFHPNAIDAGTPPSSSADGA